MSDLGENIDCLRQGVPERLTPDEAREIATHLDKLDNELFEFKNNLTLAVVQRKWTETADTLDRLRYELKVELGGSPEHEAADEQLLAGVRRAVEAESTVGAMQGRIQELEAQTFSGEELDFLRRMFSTGEAELEGTSSFRPELSERVNRKLWPEGD